MRAIRLTFVLFCITLAFAAFSSVGNDAQAESVQRDYGLEPASQEYGPFTCQLPADGDLKNCAEAIRVPYGGAVGVNLFSAESAGDPQPVTFIANDKNKNNNFGLYAFEANESRGVYQFLGEHFPRDGSLDPAALRLYASADGGEYTFITFTIRVTD